MAPSLYTLLAAGSLITAAFARPAPEAQREAGNRGNGNNSKWHRYSTDELQQLKPSMPTLDGLASNSNVTLFVPVLGIGNQNYTCNGTHFVQTEASSGATADLFDITALLMNDASVVDTIAEDHQDGQLEGLGPQVGLHYFSEDHVPVFNLTEAPEEAVLAGKKVAGVDAPCKESDIPWLFIQDAGNGVSKKLNTVYRVDTDRGTPKRDTCREVGKTKVKPYAAQYWFFY